MASTSQIEVEEVQAGGQAAPVSDGKTVAMSAAAVMASASELPHEAEHTVPHHLVAAFSVTPPAQRDVGEDVFNTLDLTIVRDNSNRVDTNSALVNAVNDYDFQGSCFGTVGGFALSAASLGCYYTAQRRVIHPGHFGHYISSGRHMLVLPGIHSLVSLTDRWAEPAEVAMDDETNHVRAFGSKTVMIVPENHVGGAFRIGKHSDEGEDGEFVLFGPGRHVLPEENYRHTQVVKLTEGRVRLGPLHILYIKEGFLGGAFRRNTGTYEVFNPGPPLILHEKHWSDVQLIERSMGQYRLGPLTYVSVLEGQLAGAFNKSTGRFQVLPPGNTYVLHSQEFADVSVARRTEKFQLGPFYFLTVTDGYVAGAFKKKSGVFMSFPPGSSYQLNVEDWEAPSATKRDSHMVKCGPLTYLTSRPDMLMGAFRTKDGAFEEFNEAGKEYVLHERDYHSITNIPKYSEKPADFGPNVVVTIPDGYWGVFARQGRIEIKEPGFYQVSSEYAVLPAIPSRTYTRQHEGLNFKSKDGIRMAVSLNVVWRVNDASAVALFPGTFSDLVQALSSTTEVNLVKNCQSYNREELLPTQQDIFAGRGSELSEAELKTLLAEAEARKGKVYGVMEETVLETLRTRSTMGAWGIEIVSVLLEGFQLLDEGIIDDLTKITRSIIATKSEKVRGELAIAQAEAEKRTNEKKAEAVAAVKIQDARAAAQVQETQASAQARTRVLAAEAENEVQILQASTRAKADAEARGVELEIETRERREKLEISVKERRETAQADADAMRILAEAQFEKSKKENEAAMMVPPAQVELEKARYAVEALEKIGAAAWRHPEPMQEALAALKPYLRLGSMTLSDLTKNAAAVEAVDGAAAGGKARR